MYGLGNAFIELHWLAGKLASLLLDSLCNWLILDIKIGALVLEGVNRAHIVMLPLLSTSTCERWQIDKGIVHFSRFILWTCSGTCVISGIPRFIYSKLAYYLWAQSSPAIWRSCPSRESALIQIYMSLHEGMFHICMILLLITWVSIHVGFSLGEIWGVLIYK